MPIKKFERVASVGKVQQVVKRLMTYAALAIFSTIIGQMQKTYQKKWANVELDLLANRRTTIKSFRLDPYVASLLSKVTDQLNLTESEYVSNVLRKILTIEPLRILDGIAMSKILFQEMLALTNPVALEIQAYRCSCTHNNYQQNCQYKLQDAGLGRISRDKFQIVHSTKRRATLSYL